MTVLKTYEKSAISGKMLTEFPNTLCNEKPVIS